MLRTGSLRVSDYAHMRAQHAGRTVTCSPIRKATIRGTAGSKSPFAREPERQNVRLGTYILRPRVRDEVVERLRGTTGLRVQRGQRASGS